MAFRRKIIILVSIVLLLLCGITWGCLSYLLSEQDKQEFYDSCCAAYYISQPSRASIFLVNDVRGVEWGALPLLSVSYIPPSDIWNSRTPDVVKPLHVAYYSQNDVAVWCAVTVNDANRIVRFITDSLCGGYAPVEEKMEWGRMLHFATSDNRFLHLFLAPGVMGCSYRERLLKPHGVDSALAGAIEGVQRMSNCGVVYHADSYHYNDIYVDDYGCEVRWIAEECIEGVSDEVLLDTALVSSRAVMTMQLNKPHHQALSSVSVLAYIPSSTDSTNLDCVVAIPIMQPAMLSQELLSVYTPYGYRADSVKIKQWLAPELVNADRYWLAVRDSILYASPSHDAMWSYIGDLHRVDCVDNDVHRSAAAVTVVGDSIKWDLLPGYISEQIPAYVKAVSSQSLRISPCNKGFRYSVRVD